MMDIEQWPIERFREYENNPRVNDHVVDRFAEIIDRFGFRVPMLVQSDGLIVDGHFRLKAARQLGLEVLPVILCDDMSEDEIKAFRLSVNKASELAEWDMDLLADEIKALQDSDFNIEVIGFDASEMQNILDLPSDKESDNPGISPDLRDYVIQIECDSETDQLEKIDRIVEIGITKCKALQF